jgi:hypothetical protein
VTIKTSITGRDDYTIAQVLAYASEMLKFLGLPFDEPISRDDMGKLLEAMGGTFAEQHRAAARSKLRAEEWPMHDHLPLHLRHALTD